jgi:hypothetical protein
VPRLVVILLVCLFALLGAGNRAEAKVSAGQKTASGVFANPPPDHAWENQPQANDARRVDAVVYGKTASGRPFFANGDPVNGFDPDGRLAKKGWAAFSEASAMNAELEHQRLINDPYFQRGMQIGQSVEDYGFYTGLNAELNFMFGAVEMYHGQDANGEDLTGWGYLGRSINIAAGTLAVAGGVSAAGLGPVTTLNPLKGGANLFDGISSHELSSLTSKAAKDWVKGASDVVPERSELLRLQEIARRAVEAGKQSSTNPVQSQRLQKIQEALNNLGEGN